MNRVMAKGFAYKHIVLGRADRDDYVDIIWSNIEEGRAGNLFSHIGTEGLKAPDAFSVVFLLKISIFRQFRQIRFELYYTLGDQL